MANTTNSEFLVTGLFNDKASAECAYDALTARGYDKDNTDVVMSNDTRDKYYSGATAEDTELGSKAAEGTGAGAAIGGTVGAVLAAIAAIGTSVVLPGLGFDRCRTACCRFGWRRSRRSRRRTARRARRFGHPGRTRRRL